MSLAKFANKYRNLSRYAPEVTSNDEVNARKFICALKPQISKQLAGFQIKTFQEALSRGFSIEREEENRMTEKERRLKQMPEQFQERHDSSKRQMTSMASQTFFRPSGQPWQIGSTSLLSPSSSVQTKPGTVRHDNIIPLGQNDRPQGELVHLQQVRPQGTINFSQMGCFYCKKPGHLRKNFPERPQQGMVYSVAQEDIPTQEVLKEGDIMYAVTPGNGSATDQVVGVPGEISVTEGGEKEGEYYVWVE